MQLVRPAPLLSCFVCVSSPLETGERRREEVEGEGKWEAYEGRTVSLNIKEKTKIRSSLGELRVWQQGEGRERDGKGGRIKYLTCKPAKWLQSNKPCQEIKTAN